MTSEEVPDISGSFPVYETYLSHVNKQLPMPLAAIVTLADLTASSSATTLHELLLQIKQASESLKKKVRNPIALMAGTEAYGRFVLRESRAGQSLDFSSHKNHLSTFARDFAMSVAPLCKDKIAKSVLSFLQPDAVILTHSYSRVVMHALLLAHAKNKRISVYVTEGRPGSLGLRTHRELTDAGIPCTLLLDSSVAFIMDRVDLVMVGSEAVVESGGLINSVGSYQVALLAKALNKPFYALAESFKFLRLFPLSQSDMPIPPSLGFTAVAPLDKSAKSPSTEMINLHPEVDYTTPDLIDLVFSDVGQLTVEGVSQHLVGAFADY